MCLQAQITLIMFCTSSLGRDFKLKVVLSDDDNIDDIDHW